MYVQRNTEARSRNQFCCGKAIVISITYFYVSVCVCVDGWVGAGATSYA